MDDILKDVLGSCLREQPYEPARCRDMAKDIAEVLLHSRHEAAILSLCLDGVSGRWPSRWGGPQI